MYWQTRALYDMLLYLNFKGIRTDALKEWQAFLFLELSFFFKPEDQHNIFSWEPLAPNVKFPAYEISSMYPLLCDDLLYSVESGLERILCGILFNSLSKDKKLDQSKLKASADGRIRVTEKWN